MGWDYGGFTVDISSRNKRIRKGVRIFKPVMGHYCNKVQYFIRNMTTEVVFILSELAVISPSYC
jgi:hypothetical protein